MRLDQPVLDQPATEAAATPDAGRCFACGYALHGLPVAGTCPECGTAYTERSARQLQTWARAILSNAWLAWPIPALAAAVSFIIFAAPHCRELPYALLVLVMPWIGLALAAKIPINLHLFGRRALQQSLPVHTRSRGNVLVLRWLGTLMVVVLGLALVAVYAIFVLHFWLSNMTI